MQRDRSHKTYVEFDLLECMLVVMSTTESHMAKLGKITSLLWIVINSYHEK